MKYILDTNICIYIIKQKPAWVREKFNALPPESVGVSSITSSELYYGVSKSRNVSQNRQALVEFLSPLLVAPYDETAALSYGDLRASLEKSGNVIGSLDMLIAAHALSLGVTLVTNNVGEFQRVAGLAFENWAGN
ncbi:MAG: type II toxin-antitoxin system VapC family toxin [Planctomycetes bacterium]|nr:type II toxin-antitoxin system VapC family toxin [Planctomycetota bacterium]